MSNCRQRLERFVAVFLMIFIVHCWPAGARGAEPSADSPPPRAEEEAVPEKPLEKPPEVPTILPGVTPAMPYLPFSPYNTLQPGAQTGILAPYGSGFAQDTLRRGWQKHRLGPVGVSPFFEYDALFRTNVFQTANDKKADFVNVINPGFRFELPVAQQHRLSMGYLGNYFVYSRYDSQSHLDHNFNADAAFNFNRLSLRCGSSFRSATEESNAVNLSTRQYYMITPYFQAAYGLADRWRVEGNYQFSGLSFLKQSSHIDDSQDHIFGATLFYKFWPKTSAFLQYVADIRLHPFSSVQNNTVHSPFVGLSWDPTAKITGSIKVGYSVTSNANNGPVNVGGNVVGQNSATNTWSFSVQTIYRYSNYTSISLLAQRSIQEDPDFNNNQFINSGLTASLSHYFHYFKVSSYITFSFYNNNYVNTVTNAVTNVSQNQNANFITIGGGLSRPLTPWLRLRLDYFYTDKSSNSSGFNNLSYNEHQALAGFQCSF